MIIYFLIIALIITNELIICIKFRVSLNSQVLAQKHRQELWTVDLVCLCEPTWHSAQLQWIYLVFHQ